MNDTPEQKYSKAGRGERRRIYRDYKKRKPDIVAFPTFNRQILEAAEKQKHE